MMRAITCRVVNLILMRFTSCELSFLRYPRHRFILLYPDTTTVWTIPPPLDSPYGKPRKIWVFPF
jgi:hypothetical protein